ncbi:MAG TPA: LacI family DNA-binding transcriptional regulator [Bauldia sp.]|nr:LacI family DNA-binding transcriptional regulator [Bauldia sp.]
MNKRITPAAGKRARRSITIRDVARRAGVSTATVSRALANPDQVAEATRTLVFDAIAETGFTPNAAARSLRARSTKMVLALLHGIGDSFYTVILNAIERTLASAGYGMIMGDSRSESGRQQHYDRLVRSGQVDGVLLFSSHLSAECMAEIEGKIPVLLVCNAMPDLPGLPIVEVANRDAGFEMTNYLIGLGHRHIAHIGGPAGNVEALERERGIAEAFAGAGLPPENLQLWDGAFSFEAGAAAAKRFLALARRPTAVFGASDQVAIGFIKAVRDAGLSVPGDVSVAGFDDIEYANLFSPALTTMRQPRADLGRAAAENLVERMTGLAGGPTRTRLPCTLVVRDSVRAIAPQSKPRSKAGEAKAPA